MALYPYSASIKDEALGITTFDRDVEVGICWDRPNGWSIYSVICEGRNLFAGDALSQKIAAAIANMAEDELVNEGPLWRAAYHGEREAA